MRDAYGYPPAAEYELTRDGAQILVGTEGECWAWLHRNTASSVSWALRYEGYKMEPTT